MISVSIVDLILSQKVVYKNLKPIYCTDYKKCNYGFDAKWDISTSHGYFRDYTMYYYDNTLTFRKNNDFINIHIKDVKEILKYEEPREKYKSKNGGIYCGDKDYIIVLNDDTEFFLKKKPDNNTPV